MSKRNHIRMLLYEGKKHSVKEISGIVGMTVRTVYNTISKLKSEMTLQHRPGAGRPAKLIKTIKKYVVKSVSVKPSTSIRTLTAHCLVEVSRGTVARCLKQLDYSKPFPTQVPMLSEKNRLYRIEWAEKNLHIQIGNTQYSQMRHQFGFLEDAYECGRKGEMFVFSQLSNILQKFIFGRPSLQLAPSHCVFLLISSLLHYLLRS